jgi:hypothetical protein
LSQPQSIIIDTGPLLTYLALRYLDRHNAQKARRDQVFNELLPGITFADTEQQHLRRAMSREVLTTPHVLTEVFKLREPSILKKLEGFLACGLDILGQGRIIEIPCPTAKLCEDRGFRELICRRGLTDAGLVFVAMQQQSALLLTDDSRLFGDYPAGAGFEIRLLNDYLQE